MMKKLLVCFLAILLCLSLIPSFAASGEENPAEIETELTTGDDTDVEIGDGPEEVVPSEPTLEDKAIRHKIDSDEVLKLTTADFEQACLDETGANLSYVKFKTVSVGTLWYDYTSTKKEKVKETTSYYKNSTTSTKKSISLITYVPKSTTDGEVTIEYTGYTAKNESFDGLLIITVKKIEDKGDLERLVYYVEPGKKQALSADDINKLCRTSGFTLSYATFNLPDASSQGTLYYNYKASSSSNTKVKAATKYYKSAGKTTVIDNITLVVSKNAEENFDITYYAYDSDGEKYEGVISIKTETSSGDYAIFYEVSGESVFFVPSDFNDICKEETGAKLSYVKFSKPSVGTLYYDYDNEEGAKAVMSTSKSYYYGKSPYLYLMAYVPKSGYEGTVSIDYVGYSVDGDSYNGTVTVKVDTKDTEKASDISYSVKNTSYKTFSVTNFTSACKNATGETLSYVKFTLPSSSYGTLYYKYSATKSNNEKVSASTKYYNTKEDYIKYVTFVPKSGYKGTVTISYTGFTTDDTRFSGKIKITVSGSTSSSSSSSSSSKGPDAISYKGEVGKVVEFAAKDFYNICDDYYEEELSYVEFEIPSSTSGVLYYDYNGSKETKLKSTHELFYDDDDEMLLSEVSFVPAKAGSITIKYTAYTIDDGEFDGTVVVKVEKKGGLDNFGYQRSYLRTTFNDIDEDAWYGENQTQAVKLAYRYGFVNGRTDGSFDPYGNMTIAEALTIAARVHDIYAGTETRFNAGETWYDSYVNYAISKKIIKKTDFVDYERKITREEMAYIFANIIPSDEIEEINDVYELPDVDEYNQYFDSIIYLYKVGVLAGNDDEGTFYPDSYVSRAEASAFIVRLIDPDERVRKSFN